MTRSTFDYLLEKIELKVCGILAFLYKNYLRVSSTNIFHRSNLKEEQTVSLLGEI